MGREGVGLFNKNNFIKASYWFREDCEFVFNLSMRHLTDESLAPELIAVERAEAARRLGAAINRVCSSIDDLNRYSDIEGIEFTNHAVKPLVFNHHGDVRHLFRNET